MRARRATAAVAAPGSELVGEWPTGRAPVNAISTVRIDAF
jgi:hypothetical protein